MRKALALTAAVASVFAGTAVPLLPPSVAVAQSWREDPCYAQKHKAGRNGAIAGGVLGAIIGSQAAGRGSHTEGALIGGGAGALAGHQIGKSSVSCTAYPRGYRYHAGCHWVTDYSRHRARSYEICRSRDGYWRPYS